MLNSAATVATHAGVDVERPRSTQREAVAHTIIDLARQPYCQLIVLEAHGRSGVVRALIGSVAEGVARHSNVPVLLAPPTASV